MKVLMGDHEVPFREDVHVGKLLTQMHEVINIQINDSDDDYDHDKNIENDNGGKKRKRKRGKAII